MRDLRTGHVLPLREAFDLKLIDERSASVDVTKAERLRLTLDPMLTGCDSDVMSLNLDDALTVGLFDVDAGVVLQPRTGARLSLTKAIERHVIDANYVTVLDPATGTHMTLYDALRAGVVDATSGEVTGADVTLGASQAFRSGILQSCIDFDDNSFVDPTSGQRCSLPEALARGVIDGEHVRVYDFNRGVRVSLAEALRTRIVDAESFDFLESRGASLRLRLCDALKFGLVTIRGAPLLPSSASTSRRTEHTQVVRSVAVEQGES